MFYLYLLIFKYYYYYDYYLCIYLIFYKYNTHKNITIVYFELLKRLFPRDIYGFSISCYEVHARTRV